MRYRKIPLTFLLVLFLGATSAHAKKVPKYKYEPMRQLTPEQAALVQRAIVRERALIKEIQQRTPLVETYIQDTRPDPKLYEAPVDDQYMLSRVDFGRGFFDRSYSPRTMEEHRKWFKGSYSAISTLTRILGLEKFTYSSTGFMQMMFIDPTGFDQQHYDFSFVRREFLGSVRTWVFDVHPKPTVKGLGRFYGRVWIEDQGGNVVRFNGTYTGSGSEDSSKYYFHFDSWRLNVQPDIWLPVAIYVEETQRAEGNRNSLGLKAHTHFWGYSLKLPTRDSENVTVTVDNAVDKSNDSQDVSPLEASRLWIEQAEENVLDRLEEAGLIAPVTQGGYEQKILDQIAVNLIVPNNLAFTEQVHCRVMLMDTLEATTVGNTILLSKGLVDSLPNEVSIAAVVAMELAHIALGHHIDTRYAFNDRLLFPDEATFQRIDMYHSAVDDATAAKKAMEYLENSMYKNQLPAAGLYFEQLQQRGQVLKALNTPELGDSLLKPDGTPWMSDLEHMGPAINWDDMNQMAALPLGSWLKTDPWDDTVHMLDAKRYAPMNARDKMPFEVTPIYYRLQRYAVNTPPAPAPGSTVGAPAAANEGAQPAAAADDAAPAGGQPDVNTAPAQAPPATAQNPH